MCIPTCGCSGNTTVFDQPAPAQQHHDQSGQRQSPPLHGVADMPAGRHHAGLPPRLEQAGTPLEMHPPGVGEICLPRLQLDALQTATFTVGPEQRSATASRLPAACDDDLIHGSFHLRRLAARPGGQKASLNQPQPAIFGSQGGEYRHAQLTLVGAVVEKQSLLLEIAATQRQASAFGGSFDRCLQRWGGVETRQVFALVVRPLPLP